MMGAVKDLTKLMFHTLPLQHLQADRFSSMEDVFSPLMACVRAHRWSHQYTSFFLK